MLEKRISKELKPNPEQQLVVGPLVQHLLTIGWEFEQLRFGKKEWTVPKRPSEATKREKGQSYEGFPVDIAIFDNVKTAGDPRHLVVIIECKVPTEEAGIQQLDTYLSLEPHVKLGIWTNSADPSALAAFDFRLGSGNFALRRRLLTELPRPSEKISPDEKRLFFGDLIIPSESVLRKVFEDLLDHVVANDSVVTRREVQLDQLCNILLLKLDSDKEAKAAKKQPPYFRPRLSVSETAREMKRAFQNLVNLYPAVFRDGDKQLIVSDETINLCVEKLAPYRLIDVGVSTIAVAFQVLRAAALKQGEGQYFTPQQVIEAGVKLMNVRWDDLIIDPACGTGGFLVETLIHMQAVHPDEKTEVSRWAQTHLYGIDKDAIGVKLTKAIMQIAGDGSANCVRGDSVRKNVWPSKYRELSGGNFDDGRFSVVLTNPPFGSNLKVSATDSRLAQLDIAKVGGTEFQDLEIGLLFLQRAYQLLRIGGRLGIILPETYFFSDGYKFVMDWIEPRLKPKLVLNVPMEAFQGFCRAKTNFYIFEKIADESEIHG